VLSVLAKLVAEPGKEIRAAALEALGVVYTIEGDGEMRVCSCWLLRVRLSHVLCGFGVRPCVGDFFLVRPAALEALGVVYTIEGDGEPRFSAAVDGAVCRWLSWSRLLLWRHWQRPTPFRVKV
jgi:hypothetical protein